MDHRKESITQTNPLQASPATVLTLKARILSIAQFVNTELAKIQDAEAQAAASDRNGGGGNNGRDMYVSH